MTYLPPDAAARLAKYVYHGDDRSYLYRHMWRPLCRRLVQYLPVWLAPNVITVAALLIVCLTHTIIAFYMPKLTVKDQNYLYRSEAKTTALPFAQEFLPPPPGSIFVAAAVALLLYQLLDNLDGHQARRTGTSSPLGLLMDHGCDAVNCIIGSLSVSAAISAGPCWKTWTIVINTLIVFCLSTWEEYYRGTLVLPVINGPNEGILLAVVIYLWTAWVGGPQWWYNGAVEIPSTWLPPLLRQPAPMAAVAFESAVLRRVCPFITTDDSSDNLAPVPFFFNLNCSAAYRDAPPLPTQAPFALDPRMAKYEQVVLGKVWIGHGVLQKSLLRLYGSSEAVLRVRYNTMVVLFMTAGALITCVGNIYQVYRAIRRMTPKELEQKHGSGRLHGKLPFLHALSRLLPLVLLTIMANIWFLTSQEDVYRRHPRIFSWTVGLLYTKMSVHLMVAHLCDCSFSGFRRTFVPFVLFGIHICLTYLHNVHQLRRQQAKLSNSSAAVDIETRWRAATAAGSNMTTGDFSASLQLNSSGSRVPTSRTGAYADYAYDMDEELILYEFFALSVVTFVHLAWNVIRETAAVLQVPIFSVPKEKQQLVLQQQQQSLKSKKA